MELEFKQIEQIYNSKNFLYCTNFKCRQANRTKTKKICTNTIETEKPENYAEKQ
jgi:hypothetical protein